MPGRDPPALLRVDHSNQRVSRYCAIFDDGTMVHFGTKSQQYYIDHFSVKLRNEFLYRHSRPQEPPEWSAATQPKALERWLLMECNSLEQAVALYDRRFKWTPIFPSTDAPVGPLHTQPPLPAAPAPPF